MSERHDSHSTECQRQMLKKWKSESWNDTPISKDIFLTSCSSNWPAPDGAMYDPKNKLAIGIEFKPDTESKSGIQKGIGQSVTYLNKFSASYFIIPKKVEGFKIANYTKKLFNNKIKGKLPIGLIGYDIDAEKRISIERLVDIDVDLLLETKAEKGFGRYWAKFIDNCPHAIFLALEVAKYHKSDKVGNKRAWELWKIFFDKYYFPKEYQNTLKHFPSKIIYWDNKPMEPYVKTKRGLRKRVLDRKFSEKEALEELREQTFYDGRPSLSKSTQGDNLFKSFRKNIFTFISHLGLWDENFVLTEYGEKYYNLGNKYGGHSKQFTSSIGKLILTEGRFHEFIQDLKKYSDPSLNYMEVRKDIYNKFEADGLVKRNKGRAREKNRTKRFGMELQSLSHLGILPSRNRWTIGRGFNFDDNKIEEYLKFNP